MNKRKGAVELKGERVAFLFFHLKRIEYIFFFKGAHGVGFGHGVLLLIDGSCSGLFFFYLHSVVESRNPLPAQIYTYKYIYIYAYVCILIHTHIYIYLSICL